MNTADAIIRTLGDHSVESLGRVFEKFADEGAIEGLAAAMETAVNSMRATGIKLSAAHYSIMAGMLMGETQRVMREFEKDNPGPEATDIESDMLRMTLCFKRFMDSVIAHQEGGAE